VRVELDAARRRPTASIRCASRLLPAADRAVRWRGSHSAGNREILVETGGFLADAEAVDGVVVGVADGKPVYLRDVAAFSTARRADAVRSLGRGVRHGEAGRRRRAFAPGTEYNAVTISVAKHKGANAINVAHAVVQKVEELQRTQLPDDVHVTVTRNYGESATEKSNELLLHMGIAVVSVLWF
jgi:multidrug efflux pump subunit AcrB